MRFRRLTALFSALCALSLTLGQGSVSCKSVSATDSKTESAAASEHSGMNQHDGGKQTNDKPCESSAVVCCNAMTSCGLSVSLGEPMSRGVRAPDAVTPPALVQVALSLVIPPEPPPPKA